ncbi:hypothetical protein [Burkholderia cepacia]|uniref:hypothetical protein n=1 Tax=Burkholderia cepacia TaxID=292 RepID=UPI002AB7BED8|nr:hypothetical protein [Burkholderia cepacia]
MNRGDSGANGGVARLPSPTGSEKQTRSEQEAGRKQSGSGQDRDKTRFFDDIRTQIKPADFQI